MFIFKILGWLVVLWGIADVAVNNIMERDIYQEWLGYYVPDGIYPYTHYIAFAIGVVLIGIGSAGDDAEE